MLGLEVVYGLLLSRPGWAKRATRLVRQSVGVVLFGFAAYYLAHNRPHNRPVTPQAMPPGLKAPLQELQGQYKVSSSAHCMLAILRHAAL